MSVCKDGYLPEAADPWSGTPADFALQGTWEEGQHWPSLFAEFLAPWIQAARSCKNSPWKAENTDWKQDTQDKYVITDLNRGQWYGDLEM